MARREFLEETGHEVPEGPLVDLGEIRQKSREGRPGVGGARATSTRPSAVSNTYEMEWPPRSGRMQSFPEIDRVEWFDLEDGAPEAEGRAGAVPRSATADAGIERGTLPR